MPGRRQALFLLPAVVPAALAACGRRDTAPTISAPRPEGYAWLTPLRLNVRDIEVVEAAGAEARFEPPGELVPAIEVARMGRDRLQPVGTAGRGRFTVTVASLTRERGGGGGLFSGEATERLNCVLRCRIEVTGEDGNRVAFAEAEARRNATLPGDGPAARARNATEVVAQAMGDLNVEFEVQVRRNLRDWLLDTTPSLPPAIAPAGTPGGIQREDLPRG